MAIEVEMREPTLDRGLFRDSIEDRELVVLVLALVALLYALVAVRRDARIREPRLLIGALSALTLGLLATNVEGLLEGGVAAATNALEHSCYALHTVLLAAYAWRRADRPEAA